MKRTDILIIGGGISGLSLAWWLSSSSNKDITLWEAEKRTGGLIKSTTKNGYLTEAAASMMLNFSDEVEQFLNTSGINQIKVNKAEVKHRYLLKNQQLKAVPSSILGIFTSDILSTKSKIRLMMEPFIKASKNSEQTVAEFIVERLGQEVLDYMIGPYVSCVLACDPYKAPAKAVLPRLTALADNYGSITAGIINKKVSKKKSIPKEESFSFDGGMETLIKLLSNNPKITLKKQQKAITINKINTGWLVTNQNNEMIHCNQLVLATPAPQSSQLINSVNPSLSKSLAKIKYTALSQVHLGFDKSQIKHNLSANGFLVSDKENIKIKGSLWMSSLFPNHAPKNKVLISNYLATSYQNLSKKEQTTHCLTELKKILPITGEPEMVKVNKHRTALPLYEDDYLTVVNNIKNGLAKIPSLHIAGNYIGGISTRDRIAYSQELSRQILSQLEFSTQTKPYFCPTLLVACAI
jgi:oxygen-dependent protoporphyrinogen oxidase